MNEVTLEKHKGYMDKVNMMLAFTDELDRYWNRVNYRLAVAHYNTQPIISQSLGLEFKLVDNIDSLLIYPVSNRGEELRQAYLNRSIIHLFLNATKDISKITPSQIRHWLNQDDGNLIEIEYVVSPSDFRDIVVAEMHKASFAKQVWQFNDTYVEVDYVYEDLVSWSLFNTSYTAAAKDGLERLIQSYLDYLNLRYSISLKIDKGHLEMDVDDVPRSYTVDLSSIPGSPIDSVEEFHEYLRNVSRYINHWFNDCSNHSIDLNVMLDYNTKARLLTITV